VLHGGLYVDHWADPNHLVADLHGYSVGMAYCAIVSMIRELKCRRQTREPISVGTSTNPPKETLTIITGQNVANRGKDQNDNSYLSHYGKPVNRNNGSYRISSEIMRLLVEVRRPIAQFSPTYLD
jgi:hypothetical protein